MAGLDQVDSISDPWEMLISSIWAYKCNTSSVCLTSQSGLAADLAPSSTSQVRFCPEATINSTCSASAHVFTCRPCSGFYCHHRFRSFLDAHLNAAIFQWALCWTTGKHQATHGQPPERDQAHDGYFVWPAGRLSQVRIHYEGWARFHLFPLQWHQTVFVFAEILVLGPLFVRSHHRARASYFKCL